MAKTVTNPNMVPAGSGVPPVETSVGPDDGGGISAAPAVDLPSNVDVQVLNGLPTRQVPIFNSKGKQTGWETVLDKSVQFCQPKGALIKTAHHAGSRGSGKVLVYGETGTLLARFGDRATAEKHLAACGLTLQSLLANTQKLRGRDIRSSVPADAKK